MKKLNTYVLLALFLLLPATESFGQILPPPSPIEAVRVSYDEHVRLAEDLNDFQRDLWTPFTNIMLEFTKVNPDPGVIDRNWRFDFAPAIVYTVTLGNHIRRVVTLRNNYRDFEFAGLAAILDDPATLPEVQLYADWMWSDLDGLEAQLDTISSQLNAMNVAGAGFWGLGGPAVEIGNHNRSYTRLNEMRIDHGAFLDWLDDQ